MVAARSRLLSVESEKALPFMTGPSSVLGTALLALAVFVVSNLADMLGETTFFTSHGVAVIWPTTALWVAVMLLMPRRTWPVIIAAFVAAQVAHGLHFGYANRTTVLLLIGVWTTMAGMFWVSKPS